MRDISGKQNTLRRARARAVLQVSKGTIRRLKTQDLPKGDPLPVARVAAIQAAKQTSLLIPYCHPLPIDFVECNFDIGQSSIIVETEVKAIYKTGVEMEALAAASSAVLTLYDMLKPIDESMEITSIRLLEKTGGKSDFAGRVLGKGRKAAVLVMSDSISQGKNTDRSGKTLEEGLTRGGFDVVELKVLADDMSLIERTLTELADKRQVDLIVTTGGTGLGLRDVTPEATGRVIEREAPGFVEALRSSGLQRTPLAMLSRGRAGLRGKTLIINLPGSESAVKEALDVLMPILRHAFGTMEGEGHREVRNPKSEIRSPKSEVRNPKSRTHAKSQARKPRIL